ncbi:MAG: radical SAM protein, partial [Candidatus Omnitrophica bacterium]|nr:radical SAM protein [Candidatus Omnitrophota bacterium]
QGYDVHLDDLNCYGDLFALQRKYFEQCMSYFPHWKFLNIFRNGPRYFVRHQLAFLQAAGKQNAAYHRLVSQILNFDGKSNFTDKAIDSLDGIISDIFNNVLSKTQQLVSQIEPDVIGCTMLESTLPSALIILKKAKEINHKIKTVLGGPGAIVGNVVDDGNLQDIIKKCNWIDAIIYGEGEKLFEKYLEGAWADKKIITVQDLKSLSSTQGDSGLLLDLDSLPMPDYDRLPVQGYLWMSIHASRGCPFNCAFCFENCYWVRFRQKSPKRVISEMNLLSERYKKNKFYICDSLANHIATQLSEGLLKESKKYFWDCYMRVTEDCLDIEKVSLWASGGLERARIGVESASSRVLKMMNKGVLPEQTRKSLMNFAQSGIKTTTLWIAGFPGESEADFQESIDFLNDNINSLYQADIWEFICSPSLIPSSESGSEDFSTKAMYPEEFDDLLVIKYYDLKNGPSPEVRFERIRRFEENRLKLGIPNPYSIKELISAHQRWVNLGHNRNESNFF